MWRCGSEASIRRYCAGVFAGLGSMTVLFYQAQNQAWALGGEIAIPKLLWLAYALLFWFLLPPLIAADSRIDGRLRRMYAIFFYNMAARGMIELWMIYVATNWHPYYGAAQDLFSILLILFLLRGFSPGGALDRLLVRHFYVLALMLCTEIGFALYFAANFLTSGRNALYFVPNGGRHAEILAVTAAAVGCLTVYLIVFSRRWLYAGAEG